MKFNYYIALAVLLKAISFSDVFAQSNNKSSIDNQQLIVAWWNLENLFDTVDDPGKGDDDFLPTGKKLWTQERLHRKVVNLASVIASMNTIDYTRGVTLEKAGVHVSAISDATNQGPDILGFCEVEHESLIDSLLNYLPAKYGKVYFESSDQRGIDVGMIYNTNIFTLTRSDKHPVKLNGRPTREIIEVALTLKISLPSSRGGPGWGVTHGRGTGRGRTGSGPALSSSNGWGREFTFLLNHWPSRLGGKLESEPRRLQAAQTVRAIVDDLLYKDTNSQIIMMGDFNDEPFDKSISQVLNTTADIRLMTNSKYLFNPMCHLKQQGLGTYLHGKEWDLIDQFIISKSVFEPPLGSELRGPALSPVEGGFDTSSIEIFHPDFMLTKSGHPFSTYSGGKYRGGYSDHLPIVMYLSTFPLLYKERDRVRSNSPETEQDRMVRSVPLLQGGARACPELAEGGGLH